MTTKDLAQDVLDRHGTEENTNTMLEDFQRLMCSLLYSQLQSLGLRTVGPIAVAEWRRQIGLPKLYERWLEESIQFLMEQGQVAIEDEAAATTGASVTDAAELWRQWDERKREWSKDEGVGAQMRLVEAALRGLPQILSGKRLATDILFPNSSMELVEGIYKHNKVADYFNKVLAETLQSYVARRLKQDGDARIRILEIGAGTGGTSEGIFDCLKVHKSSIAEYCYTDISKAFLLHAQQTYGPTNAYLTYRLFDTEQPVHAQGIDLGVYDAVIAANVLHATKNIRGALRNAKALLKRRGVLLLNEIGSRNLFSHLTFGLLEGWWLYEDSALRIPGTPALSAETWRRVLEGEGFTSIEFPAGASHGLGQQVIVAESDGVIRQKQSIAPENPSAKSLQRSVETKREVRAVSPSSPSEQRASVQGSIEEQVQQTIVEQLAESLKVPVDAIEPDESFADYGMDSILGVRATGMLSEALSIELPTTSLFDYPTVNKLTDYIVAEHRAVLEARWGSRSDKQGTQSEQTEHRTRAVQQAAPGREGVAPKRFSGRGRGRGAVTVRPAEALSAERAESAESNHREAIAIIGMSGRYPQSTNVEELWEHLAAGRELLEEASRWKLARPDRREGALRQLRGGFLRDIDRFDPLFFNISGVEATYMDPQQRLFLEEAWKALEDAGYVGASVEGRLCGVYVGCGSGDYSGIAGKGEAPAQAFWGNAGSIVPARISYYLNLHGPAVAVDTACSSSLVATHLACQGLWARETELALAGGISVQCTPGIYGAATKASMLSPTGRCYTFDDRADGFVVGEGVGVLVLKRLCDAQADGDHIYGVIRGSAINQDGTTNGITAPSAISQERLERQVYERFHINPEDIQLVEAHGTGTKLGDPIEYRALTKSFAASTDKKNYCAIGSIKTNIGHTLLAAGVAGIIKVLLAMKHRQMPPSLNFEQGNSHIDFENSPFFVNTTLRAWEVEVGKKRCAAVSSFGFSGTNAHVVIEEAPVSERRHADRAGYLIVLSARTAEQLKEQSQRLVACCEAAEMDCGNISYTLLLGRKHFGHRLACVVRSSAELIELLKKWLAKGKAAQVFASALGDKEVREQVALKRYGNQSIDECREGLEDGAYFERLSTLADLYVQGYDLSFEGLFANDQYSRISLPSYPFARERYWIESSVMSLVGAAVGSGVALHPLVQRNTSTMSEQRFSSTFSGDEFYLSDHVVGGRKVLPGVCYLEMARAAVRASLDVGHDGLSVELQNVIWVRPVMVEGNKEVHIALTGRGADEIEFEIYSAGEEATNDGQEIIHAQGRAMLRASQVKAETIDVGMLQAQCDRTIDVAQCYAAFSAMGVDYGAAHRGLMSLQAGLDGERGRFILAQVTLPPCVSETKDQYLLHPSVLDAALQASLGLSLFEDSSSEQTTSLRLLLPFALKSIEMIERTPVQTWVLVRPAAGSRDQQSNGRALKFDIDIYSETGSLCIRMRELNSRVFESESASGAQGPTQRPATEMDETKVLASHETKPIAAHGINTVGVDDQTLNERTGTYLRKLLAAALQVPFGRIELHEELDKYGIDSLLALKLVNELERSLGSLPKTLMFECRTLNDLTLYLIEHHRERLVAHLGSNQKDGQQSTEKSGVRPMQSTGSTPKVEQARRRQRHAVKRFSLREDIGPTTASVDIAIIGLSGRYPQARDLNAYWENLTTGKDCIVEIPAERWDHSRYFDAEKGKPGKVYSKWGGFMDGVDEFDPLFFNISPLEARLMDPQERLFLQCAIQALEDAGYRRETLNRGRTSEVAEQVGVFVGVMYEEYQLYGAEAQARGQGFALGGNPSSIANRVSYFCNFHGPSMAVDTMCSSALTAIHLACQSIKTNACAVAIAGGVNVSIHPNKYFVLAQGQFASSTGRCQSFGRGGDGYVPGEGVGAVLLKPLASAIRDGDHIYGVIKGTSVNHGGKTNGYTVPNPGAQAQVIAQALKESGCSARAVSYIEAHGTGTSLGDPIEIAGLTQAFSRHTSEAQFCAIGSAKSNIGHLESAAGIAGLTKVLLQMRHGMLVPSLHSEVLNPHIDFARTPFRVQQKLEVWQRPVIEIDGQAVEFARIAGISSFGAGGANAHVIVEEYSEKESARKSAIVISVERPALIVVSARNEERLKEQVRQLLEEVRRGTYREEDLGDIAYTLQVGREGMESRMGFAASSFLEFEQRLSGYVEGKWQSGEMDECFEGEVKKNKEALSGLNADEDMGSLVERWLERGKYSRLLELWTKGLTLDWTKLYEQGKLYGECVPRRISLPTYPFARERYWIDAFGGGSGQTAGLAGESGSSVLHPLLHRNTSDLSEQRFSSVFTGQEFYLRDHRIQGTAVLPGVCYLEMVREAVNRSAISVAGEERVMSIRDVVWMRPVMVKERKEVHVGLAVRESGDVEFEIYSLEPGLTDEAEEIIHAQGRVALVERSGVEVEPIAVERLRKCCDRAIDMRECYAGLATMGIGYGAGFQALISLEVAAETAAQEAFALGRVQLPTCVSETQGQYVLHPSVLDGALQASFGLLFAQAERNGKGETAAPMVPFALERIELVADSPAQGWVVVRASELKDGGIVQARNVQKLDIDLCDESGRICVRLKGLSLRVIEQQKSEASLGTVLLEREWHSKPLTKSANQIESEGDDGDHVVWLEERHRESATEIERRLPGVKVDIFKLPSEAEGGEFCGVGAELFGRVQALLQGKLKRTVCVQVVLDAGEAPCVGSALSGLLKSAVLENPRFRGQVIEMRAEAQVEELCAVIRENAGKEAKADVEIRYVSKGREVSGLKELSIAAANDAQISEAGWPRVPWKDGGVYLITGGAGGLGLIFAREILERTVGVRIVLAGRSELSEQKRLELEELERGSREARVEYWILDVSDEQEVKRCVELIVSRHGGLNGIVHSAGVIRDNFILKKTLEEFAAVIQPKILGTINLDRATREIELDFFMLFSSLAGVFGNVGQADYAFANAFMDGYARYRQSLVTSKKCHGRTLSLDWPLWAQGGMQVDEAVRNAMRLQGLDALSSRSGITALYQVWSSSSTQVLIVAGELKKLRQLARISEGPPKRNVASPEPLDTSADLHRGNSNDDSTPRRERISLYVRKVLSGFLQLPMDRIDPDVGLDTYGIDSIIATKLVNELEKVFGSLPKTLLFEYQSVKALTDYLYENHSEALSSQGIDAGQSGPVARDSVVRESSKFMPARNKSRLSRRRAMPEKSAEVVSVADKDNALQVAIIGLSGMYPGARNITEFWENLKAGKDCITEVPSERWDHNMYYSGEKDEVGKTSCKWGGFIHDINSFDASFFEALGKDAHLMCAEEKLLLETVWHLMESAGYTSRHLQERHGGRVGVYVGGRSFSGGATVMAAPRIAAFLRLVGPTVAVETYSAASGAALHLACAGLATGDCELAIVGGVNLLCPEVFISTASTWLSKDESRRGLSTGGGVVFSEGVGAVLLRPLDKAIADDDEILCVIKATAMNNSLSSIRRGMPTDPILLASLLRKSLDKAGVAPSTVGCIEPVLYGAAAADFTELLAYRKVFEQGTSEKGYCSVGSVESNVGHAIGVSSLAQLSKLILQLYHGKLVPTIKADPINPELNLDASPFRVQEKYEDWKRFEQNFGDELRQLPRRAMFSSKGADGTQVAVVLEEYCRVKDSIPAEVDFSDSPPTNDVMLTLSAATENQLRAIARALREHVNNHAEIKLADLAYTLNLRREALRYRLAIIVTSVGEVARRLSEYLDDSKAAATSPFGATRIFIGEKWSGRNAVRQLLEKEEESRLLKGYIEENNVEKLATFWVRGSDAELIALGWQCPGRLIPLPPYSFGGRQASCDEGKPASIIALTTSSPPFEVRQCVPAPDLGDVQMPVDA